MNIRHHHLRPREAASVAGSANRRNRFGNFGDHVTTRSTLWTLSLIGIFIIVMACINFINLATAQAVNRSKEIGIRKVLGSNRWKLFWQMMGETGIIVFAALILAGIIADVCLPFIKHIDSIDEPLNIFTTRTLVFVGMTSIVVTFFSGLYPSLVMSGFSPMSALKNKITSATICRLSGKLATDSCHESVTDKNGHVSNESTVYTEYFVEGTEPTESCPIHRRLITNPFKALAELISPSRASSPTETAAPQPPAPTAEAAPAPPAPAAAPKPEEQKKRGFWGRIFGGSKK